MPESSDTESPTPEWTQGQELSRALTGGDGKEERGRVDLSILTVLGQQLKVSHQKVLPNVLETALKGQQC